MSGYMNTLLSIDNDWFPWYGETGGGRFARFRVKDADGEWHEDVSGMFLFDWGHGENSLFLSDWIWQTRAAAFHRAGLSLQREFNVRPEYGGVSYSKFATELLRRFEPILAWMADSHMHAWEALRVAYGMAHKPVHVVHFDAHHDLGYGSQDEHAKKGILDCGDWLYQGFRQGAVARATIIYPNWRYEERPGKWLDPYRDQVEFLTWGEWLRANSKPAERIPSWVFTCRSAGWAPPFLDRKWLGLGRRLNGGKTPELVAPEDGCDKPRPWNEAEIIEQAEREQEVLREANKRNREEQTA